MLKPIDKDAAFAAIAEDLELPLVLLASPDPRVRLVQLEKIGAALLSTNLTFRDLAERVVAPRPTTVEPVTAHPAAPPTASFPPSSTIVLDHATRPPEVERTLGYRSASYPPGYGLAPTEETFTMRPGESNEEAGQRLAKWALDAEGVIYYENPETGELHPPGWVIPGKGKVLPDGTLGPLPEENSVSV